MKWFIVWAGLFASLIIIALLLAAFNTTKTVPTDMICVLPEKEK